MKFTCEQKTLSKALTIVSKAVSTRSTMPILKGILLTAYPDGRLKLSASDTDITIQDTIAVNVAEPGSVVVMAKLFSDIVRKLPASEVVITSSDNGDGETENNEVNISSMNSEFHIVGMSAEEFPVISSINEETESINIDKKTVRSMIEKTAFAASADEARGIITGVLVELSAGSINMVAIDGYRMAINRRTSPDIGTHEFVISAKILRELARIISEVENDEDNGVLYLDERKATFRFGNIRVELKLMNGKFIAYQNILPKNARITAVVNREQLQESIERASLLTTAGKNNLIRMNVRDTVMTISSFSEEGKVEEEVITTKQGEDLMIGFNAHYLLDVLKSVEDEEVKILFNSPVDPCLIVPMEGDEYEYLVLPVRI